MNIGIMGGTFNPIHNGHLRLAEYAVRDFTLDEVWFLPNGNPPHKNGKGMNASLKDRIEMVRLAIEGDANYRLCLYEATTDRISYSYDTMEHLTARYPDVHFYFIIGADSLFTLEQWYHPERLLAVCTILAACRDDVSTAEMEEQIGLLNRKYHSDIRFMPMPAIDLASREIREQLLYKKADDVGLPSAVSRYIFAHNLYKGDENEPGTISGMQKKTEKMFG